MLWVKSFHIIFVASWFAGLFYLPRIFVNLAMVPPESVAERGRLMLMAGKLLRFTRILSVPAVLLGLWLWLGYGFSGGWLHWKLALVAVLIAYHLYCGKLLTDFRHDRNRHSHVFYRWLNEFPVVILIAVVILVVVKPF